MAKVLGIDFAPLWIPKERRLQTLSVYFFIFMFIVFPVFVTWLFLYILLYTSYWWIMAIYFVWLYFDWNAPSRGSRPWSWLKHANFWKHFRDYFPVKLVKVEDLNPSHNYVFGYHPHGIASLGCFINFGTFATDFDKLFPGIKPYVCTLSQNFWFPLKRQLTMFHGGVVASKESIEFLLSKNGIGNAAVIVIGGAEEALDANPGRFDVLLQKRKGFVKLALKNGAYLVPVYSFGENDLYVQVANPKGSLLRSFQVKAKNIFGFSPPLFHGRSALNYTFGILPFRKPINTVVGKAIPVEKIEEPTTEQVNDLHAMYKEALNDLFETHKQTYGIAEDVHLNII